MPNFATFTDMRKINANMGGQSRALVENFAKTASAKDTFLSHSSKDAEFLPAVIKVLQDHGASVYCDLEDSSLPGEPNPDTAQIIQTMITRCKRLVVFITPNSKDSKWVPWELGIADATHGGQQVALFPVAANSYEQVWAQQEYLGLYSHIVWGPLQGYTKDVWMVYDYRKNQATELSNWCR